MFTCNPPLPRTKVYHIIHTALPPPSLLVLPSQDGILGSNIIMIDEVISTLSIVIGARVLWNMRAASNVMMDVEYAPE